MEEKEVGQYFHLEMLEKPGVYPGEDKHLGDVRARARVCVYRGVDARKNSFQIFKGVIHKKVLLYNI